LGNVGRNSVVGPNFKNFDLSVFKNTKLTEKMNLEFHVDALDLFNHPNYGQPGRTFSPTSTSLESSLVHVSQPAIQDHPADAGGDEAEVLGNRVKVKLKRTGLGRCAFCVEAYV